MPFRTNWTDEASDQFEQLMQAAVAARDKRAKQGVRKSTKAEGLFKQVEKCISLLIENPRHPGLHTHRFYSMEHPYVADAHVYVAYAQNKTPGAYRVFWCYGPDRDVLTVIAITPHP